MNQLEKVITWRNVEILFFFFFSTGFFFFLSKNDNQMSLHSRKGLFDDNELVYPSLWQNLDFFFHSDPTTESSYQLKSHHKENCLKGLD